MEVDLDRLYDNNVKIVELRQSTDSDKELLNWRSFQRRLKRARRRLVLPTRDKE